MVARDRGLFSARTIDLFAGGGGASEGVAAATGVSPLVAINHDPAAIAMHAANHPHTHHHCESIHDVRPYRPDGRPLDLVWASPDCTHFSRAKGSAPKSKGIRSLSWALARWAASTKPRVIAMENVSEIQGWGPLGEDGEPIKARAGETWARFLARLRELGYHVEHRVLCAADYGAPTSRRRLILVGRRDGQPIVWPTPTHGPGRPLPWRTAAECIDWSIPCPSIFGRKRPLAEATMARIAAGLQRYVIDCPDPFIVPGQSAVATMIQTGYGERKGQRPRTLDIRAPLGTVVAGGVKHALVVAWLAKHYTGVVGSPLTSPLGTITAIDHHSVVAAYLTAYYGSERDGQALTDPLRTIPTRDRFSLVTVTLRGQTYSVADIGMRMLQPRELATAQGFPADYVLTGNKRDQTARIGNSVPPPLVEAVIRAQRLDRRAAA